MEDEIKKQIQQYVEKHKLNQLFEELLKELATKKPKDPIQFLITLLDRKNDVVQKIILIGKPFTGKQTLAKMLSTEFGAEYIRTQDIIKTAIKSNTEEGRKADEYVKIEECIPGHLLVPMLQTKLNSEECLKNGWIISGFPQSRSQAYAMQEAGIFPAKVFLLDASDDTVKQRAPMNEEEMNRLEKKLDRWNRNSGDVLKILKNSITVVDASKPIEHMFTCIKRHLLQQPIVKTFVMLGTPCSGKTTQARKVAQYFGLVYVSLIEAISYLARTGNELGKQSKQLIEQQELPKELETKVILERLKSEDCIKKGWILDGFPRTSDQAAELIKAGLFPDLVFVLDIPSEEVSKRSSGRVIDPKTMQIYHKTNIPPPKEITKQLTMLKDDEDFSIIEKSCVEYKQHIESINSQFGNVVKNFNGMHHHHLITAQLVNTIRGETENIQKFFLLGPPLSGKSTQSLELQNVFGSVIITPKEVIAENIRFQTTLGIAAKKLIDAGKKVDDEIVVQMIKQRLQRPDCLQKGWVISGWPQTRQQAQLLYDNYICPSTIILLEAKKDDLLKRLEGRRVDPVTGKTWHLKYNIPPLDILKRLKKEEYSDIRINNGFYHYETNKKQIRDIFKGVSANILVNANQMTKKVSQDMLLLLNGYTQVLKIVLVGPPGSGKKTHGQFIAQKYGVVHINAGDIVREAVKEDSPLSSQIKPYIDKNLLIPDELLLPAIEERLNREDCRQKGWLLQGFPRTKNQADYMIRERLIPDLFISLKVPESVILERILQFRSEKKKKDKSGQPRNFHQEESLIKARIKKHQQARSAVEEVFRECLFEVNGELETETNWKLIEQEIDKWYAQLV